MSIVLNLCNNFNNFIFNLGGQKPKTPGGIAPTFKEKPKVAQDPSGKNLVIECSCTANPKPELFWFKDGVTLPLSATKKSTLTQSGNEFVIKLEILVSEDLHVRD